MCGTISCSNIIRDARTGTCNTTAPPRVAGGDQRPGFLRETWTEDLPWPSARPLTQFELIDPRFKPPPLMANFHRSGLNVSVPVWSLALLTALPPAWGAGAAACAGGDATPGSPGVAARCAGTTFGALRRAGAPSAGPRPRPPVLRQRRQPPESPADTDNGVTRGHRSRPRPPPRRPAAGGGSRLPGTARCDPTDGAVLQLLGLMAQSQGRLPVALKLMRLAVSAGPRVPEFANSLGTVLGDLRRFDESIAAFDAAVWRCAGLRRRPPQPRRRPGQGRPAGRSAGGLPNVPPAVAGRPTGLGRAHCRLPRGRRRGGDGGRHPAARRPPTARRRTAQRPALRPALPPRPAAPIPIRGAQGLGGPSRRAAPRRVAVARQPPGPGAAPADRLRLRRVPRAHPVARFQEAAPAHRDRGAIRGDLLRRRRQARRHDGAAEGAGRRVGGRDGPVGRGTWPSASVPTASTSSVDLDGHDAPSRLLCFARRPAPVQVTYNGYVDTTGMAAMDWRVTDACHDPPGTTERYHTEQLYRLPECGWCYRPTRTRRPWRNCRPSATGSSGSGA